MGNGPTPQLNPRGTNWLKQRYWFLRPVPVGEPITAVVEITRLRPEKQLITLSNRLSNGRGQLVCYGETLVKSPPHLDVM